MSTCAIPGASRKRIAHRHAGRAGRRHHRRARHAQQPRRARPITPAALARQTGAGGGGRLLRYRLPLRRDAGQPGHLSPRWPARSSASSLSGPHHRHAAGRAPGDMRAIFAAWPAAKPLLVHAEERTVAAVLGMLAAAAPPRPFLPRQPGRGDRHDPRGEGARAAGDVRGRPAPPLPERGRPAPARPLRADEAAPAHGGRRGRPLGQPRRDRHDRHRPCAAHPRRERRAPAPPTACPACKPRCPSCSPPWPPGASHWTGWWN